jgi:hypothetical protein
LKSGEIANGDIFRGEGVRNLLDEKLLQQFAHAKRMMEQKRRASELKCLFNDPEQDGSATYSKTSITEKKWQEIKKEASLEERGNRRRREQM